MLVLRRKVGQSILLGENIHVTILAIEGERVKIGISAPVHIPVVREELLDTHAEEIRPIPSDKPASPGNARNPKQGNM